MAKKDEGKGKADQKQVQAANEAAINCFPKGKLIACLDAMADGSQVVNEAGEAIGSASFQLVQLAQTYGVEARAVVDDTSVILKDWRENQRLMATELAAQGHRFASKEGEKAAKLTGTGDNVMSIAKGVVDFGVDTDKCLDHEGNPSYRAVRSVVEAKRAERRAKENPDAAKLAEAKTACREAAKELLTLVLGTNDIELIEILTESFGEMQGDEASRQDEAERIEQEAAEAKAAEQEAEKEAA